MVESTHRAAILIVDDDEAGLDLLRIRLRAAGFENLSVATSGQQALDCIGGALPDIVLLDVMMPGMDGYEVIRRIRQTYADQFVPIILISVLDRAQDRIKGIEAGANDFISKPYDVGEVVARINGLLALKRARDALNAETQRALEALSRYMSPALVERVLNDPDSLTRREQREAFVLFADLRGFTRLTVEHPPDEVVALLNHFFTEMMEIVHQHEGVIFDIAGDELLTGFNVPYSQPDARERALATAIAMQRRFAELRAGWAGMGMQMGMGIGISAGPVVLGHVGGRSRMNYAMVGEAVTIAHRLVEMAEDGQIAVSQEVASGGLSSFDGLRVRELPSQTIEGTDRPQRVTMIELAG